MKQGRSEMMLDEKEAARGSKRRIDIIGSNSSIKERV